TKGVVGGREALRRRFGAPGLTGAPRRSSHRTRIVFRLLGFVLLLCACVLPNTLAVGAWVVATRGHDQAFQPERPMARQAAPDDENGSGANDTEGTPLSSDTLDDDDLVPEQDPAEPAPIVVSVVQM